MRNNLLLYGYPFIHILFLLSIQRRICFPGTRHDFQPDLFGHVKRPTFDRWYLKYKYYLQTFFLIWVIGVNQSFRLFPKVNFPVSAPLSPNNSYFGERVFNSDVHFVYYNVRVSRETSACQLNSLPSQLLRLLQLAKFITVIFASTLAFASGYRVTCGRLVESEPS